MNVGQVLQRYFNDWQKFALVGLGALLVELAWGIITFFLSLLMIGPAVVSMLRMDYYGLEYGPGQVFGMLGALGGVAIVALIGGVVAVGMANGGLVGSVVAYRRGEDVGLSTFWSYATRYFTKMILLGIILLAIMLVSAIVNIIPILGQLVYVLWAPVAFVTLGIYPAYLVINDGYSVGSAVGQGFQILKSQFGPSVLGGLIALLFGVIFALVGWVPVIGSLVVVIFGQPLFLYFFVERFEHDVRPYLAA